MASAGAPAELIEKRRAARLYEFEIHPFNWVALGWFLEVDSEWNWRHPMHCSGMNWLAVESESRLRGHQYTPDDFKKLKILAAEACRLMNESFE